MAFLQADAQQLFHEQHADNVVTPGRLLLVAAVYENARMAPAQDAPQHIMRQHVVVRDHFCLDQWFGDLRNGLPVHLQHPVDHVDLVALEALLLERRGHGFHLFPPLLVLIGAVVAQTFVQHQADRGYRGQQHDAYGAHERRERRGQLELPRPCEDGRGEDFAEQQQHAHREHDGQPIRHEPAEEDGQRLVGRGIPQQQSH
mmetsp:Transcript_88465/g.270794  ORF Transcript_88465/g.270794 Transcript_88465/m.270794 type:complete len:201 (-) Transcript_88465:392-994(-)